jgi:hypothetical protein
MYQVFFRYCPERRDIFEGINLLEPRFRRVTIAHYKRWLDYWPLLEACAESLEELHISATTTGE